MRNNFFSAQLAQTLILALGIFLLCSIFHFNVFDTILKKCV